MHWAAGLTQVPLTDYAQDFKSIQDWGDQRFEENLGETKLAASSSAPL